MNWLQHYRLRLYLRNSIWIMPVFGMAIALVSVNVLNRIEKYVGWLSGFDPTAVLTLFGTLAGSMFTFIVFLSSTLLLILQLASAQLSPRIIGLVFRDRVIRFSLTLFAFTFSFTIAALVRINTAVPAITAYIAAFLCMLCLGVFMFLLNHLGRTLRPSGVLLAVARLGHEIIPSVYPQRLSEGPGIARSAAGVDGGTPARTITNPKDGVLLAFDHDGIVNLARKTDCVVELVPQVGDFVAAGSPLFRTFGKEGAPEPIALCQSVAIGQERTMEQDPAFAFRIIVDIASKALSPAINDPTTAVLAIDQIHHLLCSVGSRFLDEGLAYDGSGSLRLVYKTPDWEDFVCLAVTEIRQFGGTSIQVARRLRAMLENLIEVLPCERATLLQAELALLRRFIGRSFAEPEDLAMANVGDFQGVGSRDKGRSDAQKIFHEQISPVCE
jgi:uncharacterized membrane protein